MAELPIERHRREHWPFKAPFTVDYSEVRTFSWAALCGLVAGVVGTAMAAIAFLSVYDFERIMALLFGGVGFASALIIAVVVASLVADFLFRAEVEEDDEDHPVVDL